MTTYYTLMMKGVRWCESYINEIRQNYFEVEILDEIVDALSMGNLIPDDVAALRCVMTTCLGAFKYCDILISNKHSSQNAYNEKIVLERPRVNKLKLVCCYYKLIISFCLGPIGSNLFLLKNMQMWKSIVVLA